MASARVSDQPLVAARLFTTGTGDDLARRQFISYHRSRDLDVREYPRVVKAGGVELPVHAVVVRYRPPMTARKRMHLLRRIAHDPTAKLVIEHERNGHGFIVEAIDTHPRTSPKPLAGTPRRTFVERCVDLATLKRRYPTARYLPGSTYQPATESDYR
jgi:hypothetical protein